MAKKNKIVKAVVRWHSDKFGQKFESLLRDNERERIMARVNTVSQALIELRQVYN